MRPRARHSHVTILERGFGGLWLLELVTIRSLVTLRELGAVLFIEPRERMSSARSHSWRWAVFVTPHPRAWPCRIPGRSGWLRCELGAGAQAGVVRGGAAGGDGLAGAGDDGGDEARG
jgi:hypothetical protein